MKSDHELLQAKKNARAKTSAYNKANEIMMIVLEQFTMTDDVCMKMLKEMEDIINQK